MITYIIVLLIVKLLQAMFDDEAIVARVLKKHPRLDERKLRKAVRDLRRAMKR
jgi:uncharacterized protein YneF (UPF0154 family)